MNLTGVSYLGFATACGGDPLPSNENMCRPAAGDDSDSAGAFAPEDDLEFVEYLRENGQQTPDGGWVVEGDIHFIDTNHLYSTFLGVREEARQDAAEPGELSLRSTVSCVNDLDATWDIHEKLRITYCLGEFTDEALREYVHRGLRFALRQIERTTNINYILLDGDASECADNNSVFYKVRQGTICTPTMDPTEGSATTCDCDPKENDNCYKKFGTGSFPDTSDAVNQSYNGKAIFYSHMKDKLENRGGPESTVTHEFGHTAALYHEQARFEQLGIQANNECRPEKAGFWRALTPPDSASIMGYRQCDGLSKGTSYSYSRRDRLGLAYLYTIPGRGPTRLDAGVTDDIFWVVPNSNSMTAWFGGTDGNGDIDFTSETVMLPGAVSRHVKPVPAHISDSSRTDILLYNPGTSADYLVKRDGGMWSSTTLANGGQSERHAIPLVGQFLGSTVDDVWWWLPGPDGTRHDDIWRFASNGTFTISGAYDASASADNYSRPLLGLWRPELGSGLPYSQILWWREQPLSVRLLAQNAPLTGFGGDLANESPLCGLQSGREYKPLVGNFDLDSANEILWVSPNTDLQVMWWDLSSMWGDGGGCTTTNHEAFTLANAGDTKPFVGDFDGNGIDDIFWYSGGQLPQNLDNPLDLGSVERVWLMDDHAILTNSTFLPVSRLGDFSPYVGDFNGDGCEDILWFAPHQSSSPVWRALCNSTQALIFTQQDNNEDHPVDAYPAGYDPARGRK